MTKHEHSLGRSGEPKRRSRAPGLAALLLAVVAILALATLTGGSVFAGDGAGISVDALAEDPGAYIGARVTVDGAVASPIGPHAFTIREHGIFGGEVLVVSRVDVGLPLDRPGALGLTAADTVEVTGRFLRVDLAAFERDLGTPFDLGDFAEWEGKPAILADEVVVTTGGYRLATGGIGGPIRQR